MRFLTLFLCLLLSACVELSPAGARVQVVDTMAGLEACHLLGHASVSSDDALRNATADLSGNLALKEVRSVAGSFYIYGSLYYCEHLQSAAPVAPARPSVPASVIESRPATVPESQPVPVQPRAETAISPIRDLPSRCVQRGGRWTGSLCVIDLDE